MSIARLSLIVTMVLGINACSRGADDPPPAGVASPEPAPITEQAAAPAPAPEPTPPPPPEKPPATPSPASTGKQPPSTVKPRAVPLAAPKETTKPVTSAAKPPTATVPATILIPPATKSASVANSPVTLDLVALEKQLKSTKAIGLFSKISLKNQVDDLLKEFRGHHKGKTPPTIAELHRSYDLLMMKVLSMVQDDDKKLADAIVGSRDAIWDLLADPKKFAALDV